LASGFRFSMTVTGLVDVLWILSRQLNHSPPGNAKY
jgi:hypothetical protein